MIRFDLAQAGVRFQGEASFRFVIFTRAFGTARPQRYEREHFNSWAGTDAARHNFERVTRIYGGSWTYCLNVDTAQLLAMGVHGEPVYDYIDPAHVLDLRGAE